MQAEHAIRNLIEEVDVYLSRFSGEGIGEVRAGIETFRNAPFVTSKTNAIQFQADLQLALDLLTADGFDALANAISAAAPYLKWVPYDRYPPAEIGERFAVNHAFASFIGEDAPICATNFDLGLFLIKPQVFYRDHHHAAPELYAPLTGPHGWRFARGAALDWQPAHRPIWNPPFHHHATMTGSNPFLCIFGWTHDVNETARVIACDDWGHLEQQAGALIE